MIYLLSEGGISIKALNLKVCKLEIIKKPE